MASNGAVPPPIPEVSADLKFDGGIKVSWTPVKRRIVNSLKTQGLLGYTDGTISKPPPIIITISPPARTPTIDPTITSTISPAPSQDPPKATAIFSLTPSLEEWIFRNDRAKGIIESHVEDLPSLMPDVDARTAKEVLDTLEKEFARKDGMRKVLTERNLRSLTFRETIPIDEFLNQLRALRKDAIEAGNSITDAQFREIIIAAFPTSAFDNIIQNITANPSLYTTAASVIQQISFQYSRVENHPNAVVTGDRISQAHSVAAPISPQAALMSRIEQLESMIASKMARSGNSDKKCDNCGRVGHLKDECFRKGGGKEGQYPSWWRGKRDDTVVSTTPSSSSMAIGEPTLHYAMTASDETQKVGELYADSGATDHFFRNRDDFITYTECDRVGQSSEKSTGLVIKGFGRAKKTVLEKGKSVVLIFEGALHCPSVTSDLISIAKLDDRGYQIHFGNGCAKFFSPGGTHFLTGIGSGGLYRLEEVNTKVLTAKSRSLHRLVDLSIWHRRLAHAGLQRLDILKNNDLVDGFVVAKNTLEGEGKCENCLHGSAVRRPFDAHVPVESGVLERVHLDLTGPMRTMARGGFFYSLPIVDGHSAFTRDYYLANKEAETTLMAMERYRVFAENQTGEKLRCVRVDGGREFINDRWSEWADMHGIRLEQTPAYSSSANGVAERKHGVTFAKVRTVLHESKLPENLWAMAAAYVVYTENLLPSTRNGLRIPAEVFWGSRQDISHLRPFGARGWATIVDGTLGKMDMRAREGKMVGYGERGVYLLYLPSGKVITSRDVVFEEGLPQRTLTPGGGEMEEDQGNNDHDLLFPPNATAASDATLPEKSDMNTLDIPTEVSARRTRTKFKPDPNIPLRRSTRLASSASSSTSMRTLETQPHANLASVIQSFDEVTAEFNTALTAIGIAPVPKSYSKAMEDPERWSPAIDKEIQRMEEFGVFGPLQEPPAGATILVPLWVLAHKFDGNGNIIEEKARLVVNGKTQEEGRDYYQTFAAVLRFESLRILIALWVTLGYHIWQIDFASAYLNAELDKEIYAWPPEGFPGKGTGKVMRIRKSIYGMMQAGRNWWRTLDGTYKELGYSRSQADQCVRSRVSSTGETMTGTYTDDTLGGSSSNEEMEKAKREIGSRYRIKETDSVQFALGMKLTHD
ncbi:retrovirus-related pol polyprotein from transposon tnt 1-94 [Lentinula edodes]|uniref:Retrovirus-related pol polyprotein from transposon tnt 1-94 n=1 Tax=Lentinula edodes TaxID=5353 RepID=A0A1Q3EMS6_LENED|nr:retrovirus-related pol polyprotein from transposon tnt 1-94 [Lentinula edodes]